MAQSASATRASEIRIVMFGKSKHEQTLLGSFIKGQKEVSNSIAKKSVVCSEWEKIPLSVVKTADVYSLPVEKMKHEIKKCVAQCPPGPNTLLLLVKPSDFTEDNSRNINFVLSHFGMVAYRYSMIIITENYQGGNPAVDGIIENCGQKQHKVDFSQKDFSQTHLQTLMEKIEKIVSDNRGEPLNYREGEDVLKALPTPSLNLVLFGRFHAGKSAVAAALLGDVGPLKVGVKYEAVVWGAKVSLLELPALYGKSSKEVKREMLQCVSLFPEGVHAFVLVLPLGPLTEQNKEELMTIQQTANDYTMILFSTDISPSDPHVLQYMQAKGEIQTLCENFKERHAVLNIADEKQILQFLENIKRMKAGRESGFKNEMMARPRRKSSEIVEVVEEQKADMFRIVLIGKTGCGKSATANTILGREQFTSKGGMQAVTTACQKAHVTIEGRPIAVVDTPGLFDPSQSNDKVEHELVKCVNYLAPGPHVFLLVLRIDRFTLEEQETVNLLQMVFGENAKDFTIVVFTRGDELEGQSIEQCLAEDREGHVRNLVMECGGRYHVINNKDKKNQDQVHQLLRKIESMVAGNGGSWYNSRMFREAEEAIQKKMKTILKESEEYMAKKETDLERQHKALMKATKERLEHERLSAIEEAISQELEKCKTAQDRGDQDLDGTRSYTAISQEQMRQKQQQKEQQLKQKEIKVLKELQVNFEREMKEMRRSNNAQARKQSEEMNEFRKRYSSDFLGLLVKQGREVEDLREKQLKSRDILIRQLCMKKSYKKNYQQLKTKQEEEINQMTISIHNSVNCEDVRKRHDEEIENWIEKHVKKTTQKDCSIL